MRNRRSFADMAGNLADYVDRVASQGERFVVMRDEQPVAELIPFTPGRSVRELSTMLAALPRLSREEATGYGEEIAAARIELEKVPLRDSCDR